MREFEKIKEKYRTVPIIESINGIDIVAVDSNDLWFFIGQFDLAKAAIEQNDDLREQLKQANKHIQELESENVVLQNINKSI
jgi:hypothetical protein